MYHAKHTLAHLFLMLDKEVALTFFSGFSIALYLNILTKPKHVAVVRVPDR